MLTLAGLEATQFVRTIPHKAPGRTFAAVREGKVVRRVFSTERAQSWVVDYGAARARAIEWLGDRYLLAKPVNAAESGWRKPPRTLLLASSVAARSAEQSS